MTLIAVSLCTSTAARPAFERRCKQDFFQDHETFFQDKDQHFLCTMKCFNDTCYIMHTVSTTVTELVPTKLKFLKVCHCP